MDLEIKQEGETRRLIEFSYETRIT